MQDKICEVDMEKEILKADPKLRKAVLFFIAGGGVLGFLIFSVLAPILERRITSLAPEQALQDIGLLVYAMLLIPIGFALYLVFFAVQCLKNEQFPPPQTRVIKDTEILRGSDARRRGFLILVLAIFLIVTCLWTGVFTNRFLGTMLSDKPSMQIPAQ